MEEPNAKLALSPVTRRKLTETVAEQLLAGDPRAAAGHERAVRAGADPRARRRPLDRPRGAERHRDARHRRDPARPGRVRDRRGAAGDGEPSAITAALERGVTNEFIEARLIVEVEVARLAARRRTDEDLARLEAALAEQEARLRGDVDELVNVAASFNVLLAECAHNEVLRAMIQSFVALMVERGPRVYQLDGFREWDSRSTAACTRPSATATPSGPRG